MVAMGHWDASEHNTKARGVARLVEKSRSRFKKIRSKNTSISRNATCGSRRMRAGGDGMVKAKCWERGRLELLVWSETAKKGTKNTKNGSENRKEKEGRGGREKRCLFLIP